MLVTGVDSWRHWKNEILLVDTGVLGLGENRGQEVEGGGKLFLELKGILCCVFLAKGLGCEFPRPTNKQTNKQIKNKQTNKKINK